MTATAITSLGEDTEVTEKAKRRSFTVEYKRRIVKETDACKVPGENWGSAPARGIVLVPAGDVASGTGPGATSLLEPRRPDSSRGAIRELWTMDSGTDGIERNQAGRPRSRRMSLKSKRTVGRRALLGYLALVHLASGLIPFQQARRR